MANFMNIGYDDKLLLVEAYKRFGYNEFTSTQMIDIDKRIGSRLSRISDTHHLEKVRKELIIKSGTPQWVYRLTERGINTALKITDAGI